MPYENEDSSLIASANFNNKILGETQFHSHFKFDNKYKRKLLIGLEQLFTSKKIYRHLESSKTNIYNNLQCIDGSLVSINDSSGGQFINMPFKNHACPPFFPSNAGPSSLCKTPF